MTTIYVRFLIGSVSDDNTDQIQTMSANAPANGNLQNKSFIF
jgi:hypothetical protein